MAEQNNRMSQFLSSLHENASAQQAASSIEAKRAAEDLALVALYEDLEQGRAEREAGPEYLIELDELYCEHFASRRRVG